MINTAKKVMIEADEVICSLSRNWWLFVLRGILALTIALLAFTMPAESILALTLVFGAYSFVDGVFGLIAAIRHIRKDERWSWLLFSGLLGILTGIVVMVSPFVTAWVLATFLWASFAFWSVFSGTLEIVAAMRLRKEIKGEIWFVLGGMLSVALGLYVVWVLFTSPFDALLALGWLMGFYAAVFGVLMILLGLRLRRIV